MCIVNALAIKAIAGNGPVMAIVRNLMVVEAPALDGACPHAVPHAGSENIIGLKNDERREGTEDDDGAAAEDGILPG